MTSTVQDITLSSFAAADMREINVGDILTFRSTSIAHRKNLVLRHGRSAKVTGFARNGRGAQQVAVCFLFDPRLDSEQDKDETGKYTKPIPLAVGNLITRSDASNAAAKVAHEAVEAVISQCAEKRRPWLADGKVKDMLGEQGMYDYLGQQPSTAATGPNLDDLPY